MTEARVPLLNQRDDFRVKAAEVLVGHVQDRLVHKRVQMNVLRRHEQDTLDDANMGELRREVGAVFPIRPLATAKPSPPLESENTVMEKSPFVRYSASKSFITVTDFEIFDM